MESSKLENLEAHFKELKETLATKDKEQALILFSAIADFLDPQERQGIATK